jgi:hypothetical protein
MTATPDLIDELFALRESKRVLEAQVKEIESRVSEIKAELVPRFQDEGTQSTATKTASVTLTETVLPQVTDWDAFYAFIKDTDSFYLLERRPASTAWRELHNADMTPPGTQAFTKFDLNLRKR